MKADRENLDHNRFYEITDVEKGTPWYDEPGSAYCSLGAIVQPSKDLSDAFTVIKPSTTGFLSVSVTDDRALYLGNKMTLRPLSNKDQAKLQRIRDQFCA